MTSCPFACFFVCVRSMWPCRNQVVLQCNPGVSLLQGMLQPADQQDVMFLSWPRLPALGSLRTAMDYAQQPAQPTDSGGSQFSLTDVLAYRKQCRFAVRVRLCSPRYRAFGWSQVPVFMLAHPMHSMRPPFWTSVLSAFVCQVDDTPDSCVYAGGSTEDMCSYFELGHGAVQPPDGTGSPDKVGSVAPLRINVERIFAGVANMFSPASTSTSVSKLRAYSVHARMWVPYWILNRTPNDLVFSFDNKGSVLAGSLASIPVCAAAPSMPTPLALD
jgi:hypothetical protein